jgi:hypothetical protein
MSRKRLFTLSLFLPLMALSGTAYAGSTITDRNYWPSEVQSQTQRGVATRDAEYGLARAQASGAPVFYPSAETTGRQQQCRYRGGPKSSMACSR